MMERILFFLPLITMAGIADGQETLLDKVGKLGANGWRCNIIQSDPKNHGPDGFNYYDWDGDGDLDVLVNYEEGGYSRLYFNPGKEKIREIWTDFIEFENHGKCEDSGIGDLDNDGEVDYIANGGHVYFNPGKKALRDPKKWIKMTLFKEEARIPLVNDMDSDGLPDLIIGARAWYKQPADNKHDAANWKRFELGKAEWPMSCIFTDMDGDGDQDILVQDRNQQGIFYYVNLGKEHVREPWPVQVIDPQTGGMFMTIGDVNGDGRPDLIKAASKICVYLRTNDQGVPTYKKIEVELPAQPAGVQVKPKPKGIGLLEINGDPKHLEIVIIPEYAAQLWYLSVTGDGTSASDWINTLIDIPFPESRKKMDNAYLVDLDGDSDLDIATTDENGGWGVIWFENPAGN